MPGKLKTTHKKSRKPKSLAKLVAAEAVHETFDGKARVCWPSIVQYEHRDGKLTNYLPMDGTEFSFKVRNLELFNHLQDTHLIYQEAHTGRPQGRQMIDYRKATQ